MLIVSADAQTHARRSRHRDAVAIFFKFPLIQSRNSRRHRAGCRRRTERSSLHMKIAVIGGIGLIGFKLLALLR